MGTCRDPDAFYDLLGDACANPQSSECRGAIPRALAAHGSACLDLSYVRDNPAMPPLRPYVCEQATGGLATQCGLSSRSGAGSGTGAGAGTGSSSSTGTGASAGFAGSTVVLTGLGALGAGAVIGKKVGQMLKNPGSRNLQDSSADWGKAAPSGTEAGGGLLRGGATATAAADSGFKSANDKHIEAVRAIKEMALCHTHPLECANQDDIHSPSGDPVMAGLTEEQATSAWKEIEVHRMLVNGGDITGDDRRDAYDKLVTSLNEIHPSIVTNVTRNVSDSLGGVHRLGEAQDALRMAYCAQFPLFCHEDGDLDFEFKDGKGRSVEGYAHGGDHIKSKGPQGMRHLLEGDYDAAEALHTELKERHTGSSKKDDHTSTARTKQMNEVGARFGNRLF